MDLGNKFIDVLCNEVSASKIKKQCETICDEFAIGFAEWIDKNICSQGDGWYNRNYKDEVLTLKELLQIYKNENKTS